MNMKKAGILGAGSLVLLMVVVFEPLRFLDGIFYDLNFALSPRPAADSVAVVAVDVKSIDEVGAFPWPRSTIARLAELIDSCGPRAIALDFLFPRRAGEEENDSLAAVMSRIRNLVLPFRAVGISARPSGSSPVIPKDIFVQRFVRLSRKELLGNASFYSVTEFGAADPLFSQHARFGGFLNVSTSSTSQKIREVIHVIRTGSEFFPSFGLSAVAAYYDLKPDEFILDGGPGVILRDKRVPLSSYAATAFVNFRKDSDQTFCVSASDVLSGRADPTRLRGKLVFVGVTDPAAGADFFITPVRSQFPGVEVWATSALDIMEDRWIRWGGGWLGFLNAGVVFLLFPGFALAVPDRKKYLSVGVGVAIVAGSVAAGIWLHQAHHYFWTPANHLYAWVFSILWLALKKADPSLADRGSLDLEPPGRGQEDMLAPALEMDYVHEAPVAATAAYALRQLSASQLATSGSSDEEAETVLGTVVEASISDVKISTPTEQVAEGAELPESVLAPFRSMCNGSIVSLLGSGGMADVYLVWNPRLELYRAVKVLKPGQPSTFLTRFETEIRIVAKLNHQNIVHCYGVGDWHGLPCIEMEYVHGASTEKLLAMCGALSAEATLAVGVLVCRALHYAHTEAITIYGTTYNGVVHRDLKPANIMLSRSGRIKLTDFGIARPGEVSLHTEESSSVVGTLPYLAPEQLDGDTVSVQSDIYALGATLYEFLTGRRAFPQTEVSALVKAKALGTVAPIRSTPEIPRPLVDIIMRAMSASTGDRYASAGAMGSELEKCMRTVVKGKGYESLRQLAATLSALPRAAQEVAE